MMLVTPNALLNSSILHESGISLHVFTSQPIRGHPSGTLADFRHCEKSNGSVGSDSGVIITMLKHYTG